MKLLYKSKRLQLKLNDRTKLIRKRGPQLANAIKNKLEVLLAVENLEEAKADPRLRAHMLREDRSDQYAVKIDGRNRLIFELCDEDGRHLDDKQTNPVGITAIMILEIVDYHK